MSIETRYPLDDDLGYVKLEYTSDAELLKSLVGAARVSYDRDSKESDPEKDKKLAKYLFEHDHMSPFRHFYFTFSLKMPIFVARQWMKYQVGATWASYEADGQEVELSTFEHLYDTDKGCSWNELSGRYAVLDDDFWVPKKARVNPETGSKQKSVPSDDTLLDVDFETLCETTYEFAYRKYRYALSRGVAKELARVMLPMGTYTRVYWTVSLQGLLHFLSQRLKDDAQEEIRLYAQAIQEILQESLESLGIDITT